MQGQSCGQHSLVSCKLVGNLLWHLLANTKIWGHTGGIADQLLNTSLLQRGNQPIDAAAAGIGGTVTMLDGSYEYYHYMQVGSCDSTCTVTALYSGVIHEPGR